MQISYDPLLHLLVKMKLKKTDLLRMAKINTAALAKFSKNEPVNLKIIMRICEALNCTPADVFEFVDDKTA